MIAHHRRAAASAVHTTMLNFSQEVPLLTRIALKNISKPVLLYLLGTLSMDSIRTVIIS
jgi:hypothetical protein